jgi:hypothetical protein
MSPVASFTWNGPLTSGSHDYLFDGSASVGSTGPSGSYPIVSYKWNWGGAENRTVTTSTTVKAFGAPGTRLITLTVTDSVGLMAQVSQSVVIR